MSDILKPLSRRSFIRTASALPIIPSTLSLLDAKEAQGNMPPQAGKHLAENWANASKALILSDMTQCSPGSALSPQIRKHHWKVIPYELLNGIKGKMILASPETDAPAMKLPLGVKGYHAIFVGIFGGPDPVWTPNIVHLKLDGDPSSLTRETKVPDCHGNVLETFFKVADLHGESLEIKQQSVGVRGACGVAYVKLIPLTSSEIDQYVKDKNDKSTRKLTATNDGFGIFWQFQAMDAEALLRYVECFRGTDFDTLILQALWGGDRAPYPSKYGTMPGQDADDYLAAWARYTAEAYRELARKRINPIKVIADGVHDLGMKIHIGIRPAGWTIFEPFPDFWETPFYREHPEWRCVDRDGKIVTPLSWAVPEVRERLINLMCESVGFGADGAHLVFNRGWPMVLYEPAFLEIFKKEYGEDPRKLDEDKDPRIRKAWSDVVTTFMRELRAGLDKEEARRGDGQHLQISAMVLSTELNNYQYGLDIRRLVNEGLLDDILIYPWDMGPRREYFPKGYVDSMHPGAYDLEFFKSVCQPKGVRFRPTVADHWPNVTDQIKEVVSLYDQGVEGFCMWDTRSYTDFGDGGLWNSIYGRMGHVEEMRQRLQKEKDITPKPVVHCFRMLGNQIRDGRFPPWFGG